MVNFWIFENVGKRDLFIDYINIKFYYMKDNILNIKGI